MSPLQAALQVGHLLGQANWPIGDQGKVWREVGYAPEPPEPSMLPARSTAVLVALEGWQGDDDDPGLGTQTIGVYFWSSAVGDGLGSAAVVGGAVATQGKSGNRGVAEYAQVVHGSVGELTGLEGITIIGNAGEGAGPSFLGEGNSLVLQRILLEVRCTASPTFAAPQLLEHDGSDFTWSGAHCRARFDFQRFRLVSKAGSAAPADPSDGTDEGTVSGSDSLTVAASSGRTYAVFAEYSRRDSATLDGASSPIAGSWRAF